MAKTRPPKDTMLPTAAPVDSGEPTLVVGLPVELDVASDSSAEAVDEADSETEPVLAGTVEFPLTMGVANVPEGAMGVAVGTTTTEVTEAVSVTATVLVMSDLLGTTAPEVTGVSEETGVSEAPGTSGTATLVAGGAWIWPSEIWEMGWMLY